MSGVGNSDALVIAALAMAVHRSPARHADLLRGNAPLLPGIAVLLRLAGGTDPQELDYALVNLAPADELRQAALFFIEQVLFQRDATHYRVLGLNQGATSEQIKEHHRLLMRLFHPDREGQADERREQFATRANLAYNALRDADQRSSYDATIKHAPAAPVQAPRRAPGVVRRRMPEPESFWTVRVYPLLMRYLPQWVLAGTALVSVGIVGAVYLFNPPVHLPQPVSSVSTIAAEKPVQPAATTEGVVEIATTDATRLDEVVAQFERRLVEARAVSETAPSTEEKVAAAPAQVPLKEVAAASPKPLPPPRVDSKPVLTARVVEATLPVQRAKPVPSKSLPVARVVSRPVPTGPAKSMRPVAVVAVPMPPAAAPAPMPEPSRPVTTAAAMPLPVAEPPGPAVAAAVPAPTSAPAIEPPPPALPDPNTLLTRFLGAYERGDMQTCMALLDEAARTDAGSKSELRRDYDALFRSTDLRHIKVTSMIWLREGDTIRGEGQYRATMMRKGETLLKTQSGQIRVELVRRGGTALINELYYLANNKS